MNEQEKEMEEKNTVQREYVRGYVGNWMRGNQRVPVLAIEALPGGYVVQVQADSHQMPPRRVVVPNLDCLMSTVARWASSDHALPVDGER